MTSSGVNKDSIGCEVCKPAIGSILASLWNENIMNPVHHAYVLVFKCYMASSIATNPYSNQDTNDRFLANIQRNGKAFLHQLFIFRLIQYLCFTGTFSVIPRIAAGEVKISL
jgi:nitrite reductase (NAD(P)H)